MLTTILSFIDHHNLLPHGSTIVVGFSGGPDSMFLLHLLAGLREKRNLKLIAAHLDHEWRTDSGTDAKFCQEAAEQLGVEFAGVKMSDLGSQAKFNGSLEEHGRKMRRYFLELVMSKHEAGLIALGHHAQDQQETFLIRLIRGATLSGLCAMRPKSGPYVRPLLGTNKTAILAYLHEHSIAYLQDPSNESDQFLRNRLRTKVLPALRACDDRFEANFAHTLTALKNDESLLQKLVKREFKLVSDCQTDNISLNLKSLLKLEVEMLNRVILHWLYKEGVPFTPSQGFVAEIVRFLRQPHGGQHEIHKGWKIVKKKNDVYITK